LLFYSLEVCEALAVDYLDLAINELDEMLSICKLVKGLLSSSVFELRLNRIRVLKQNSDLR